MRLSAALFIGLCICLTRFAVAGGQPECAVVRPNPAVLAESDPELLQAVGLASSKETQLDVVDILIAFDASAQNWLVFEGKGTLEDYARACVDKMNACLDNSAISEFRFRLAGALAVDEDVSGSSLIMTLYNRLVDLDGNFVGTGAWRGVSDARERTGADIVSVLVAHGSTGVVGCGFSLDYEYRKNVSRIPDFAKFGYNVCSIQSADASCMQMHEVGHNMGCGHADASCAGAGVGIALGPQLFAYSSGYYFWKDGVGYNTIMGYNFGGLQPDGSYDPHTRFTEIPCFSSPDLTYDGVRCGTGHNDNRRTLLETYRYVAQFRVARQRAPEKPADVRPEAGGLPYLTRATVYDGYLMDEAGAPAGTVQVKVAKGKKSKASDAYTSKVTASVQIRGIKKKVSFKGGIASADGSVTDMQTKGMVLRLSLGGEILSGWVDGYRVSGVRNFFSSTDEEDKRRAKAADALFKGRYVNLAYPSGYMGLAISSKGKVKASGIIGGAKATGTAQLLVDAGQALMPIVLPKAGQTAFLVSYASDSEIAVDGLGPDCEVGIPAVLGDGAVFNLGDGAEILREALADKGVLQAERLPGAVGVRQNGKRWEVEDKALKLTYKSKGGTFSGSFRAYCQNAAGRTKSFAVSVSGLMIGNRAVGFATLKKPLRSWPVGIGVK